MRRKSVPFSFACLMLLLCSAPSPAVENTESTECLKGTIAKITESELYLMNANLPDESIENSVVMVVLDEDTRFFDGTKMTNRSMLETDNIILVYYKMVGKVRQAVLVRVIGGKKP